MYEVEPRYCFGKKIEGEWVLFKDGHPTGISSTDWPRLEAVCAALNALTPAQIEAAREVAYRKTVIEPRAA